MTEDTSKSTTNLESAHRAVVRSLPPNSNNGASPLRRRVVRTAAALAATVMGVWLGSLLWPHWTEYRDRQPPKPDAVSLTQPAIVPPAAPDTGTSLLGTDASIAEKPLQLVLVSTSRGKTLQESTASLGTDPRNPQTYAGGAILSNGARIAEIHDDRIVLSLNQRRSTLKLDREAPARVAMNSVINEQRTDAGYPILTPTLAEGQAGATSVGGRRGSVDQQDRVPTSRDDLSEFLRPQPVFENGRVAGLKLLAGTNPSRMTALGVEPGDVVRSVEGKMIESDAAWQKIDDALSSGASIVVGIERNGSLMSMSLDGANLAEPVSAPPPPSTAQSL